MRTHKPNLGKKFDENWRKNLTRKHAKFIDYRSPDKLNYQIMD